MYKVIPNLASLRFQTDILHIWEILWIIFIWIATIFTWIVIVTFVSNVYFCCLENLDKIRSIDPPFPLQNSTAAMFFFRVTCVHIKTYHVRLF